MSSEVKLDPGERLLAWCDGIQLSARVGFPEFANPSELKEAIREVVSALRVERARREKAETALRRIEEKARSGLVYVDGWTNDLRRHEIAEMARAVLAGEGDEQ